MVVQDAVEQMPVLPFLFWRFALAAAVMALLRPRAMVRLSPQKRRHGVYLGLLLGGGYILQTFGLLHTSATVSGFITGMFVVFTPLIAWLVLRQPIGPAVWLGVALATFGLALISLNGFAMGLGELLTLGCAALFGAHIVGLGQWSTAADAYGLTVIQLGVVALRRQPTAGRPRRCPPPPLSGRHWRSWPWWPPPWRSWPRPGRRPT